MIQRYKIEKSNTTDCPSTTAYPHTIAFPSTTAFPYADNFQLTSDLDGKFCLSDDVEKLEQTLEATKRQMEDYAELNKKMLEFMNEGCCACDNCCKEAREKIYKWTEAMK